MNNFKNALMPFWSTLILVGVIGGAPSGHAPVSDKAQPSPARRRSIAISGRATQWREVVSLSMTAISSS